MANDGVKGGVGESTVQPASAADVDDKRKQAAEELKEKANVCFKSMHFIAATASI